MEDLKQELSNKFLPIYFTCLILLIVFFGMTFSSYRAYHDIKDLKKQNENSELLIKQAYEKNNQIESKILEQQKIINNIDKQIGENNEKIDKLKKDEKIQIDKFKSFNASMWEKYFSDRYKNK